MKQNITIVLAPRILLYFFPDNNHPTYPVLKLQRVVLVVLTLLKMHGNIYPLLFMRFHFCDLSEFLPVLYSGSLCMKMQ